MTTIQTQNDVSFNFNNTEVHVNVSKVPSFNYDTCLLFRDFIKSHDVKDMDLDPIRSMYNLKSKAETLKGSVEKLKDAKDHPTRDRMYALIRSVLHITFVASAILSVYLINPPSVLMVLAPMFFSVAAALMGTVNANYIEFDIVKCGELFIILAIIGGPLFPIYEMFSKIPTLQDHMERNKQEVEQAFSRFVSFFDTHYDSLVKQLKSQSDSSKAAKAALEVLEDLPAIRRAKKELLEQVEANNRKLEELEKAKAFCETLKMSSKV